MFFNTGSVSKRMSELFLTSVLIKMKENQGKSCSTWVYLGIYKLIVYLTPLFDAIIVLDRLLTANFAWFNWGLTVKIFHFWQLTVTFLTVWRLTVNPIETLLLILLQCCTTASQQPLSHWILSKLRTPRVKVKYNPDCISWTIYVHVNVREKTVVRYFEASAKEIKASSTVLEYSCCVKLFHSSVILLWHSSRGRGVLPN